MIPAGVESEPEPESENSTRGRARLRLFTGILSLEDSDSVSLSVSECDFATVSLDTSESMEPLNGDAIKSGCAVLMDTGVDGC